jgi:microcystin-dependent protein
MADSTTPNLQLLQPEVGASRDSWGTKTNGNWDTVDTIMPIGAVLDFAGPTAPSGWLLCDGRLVSRTTFSDLFAAIGSHWGADDGSTNFRLPSHAGRAAIGPGIVTDGLGHTTGFAFGQTAGVVNNAIQQTNLPNISLTTSSTGVHTHGGTTSTFGNHSHAGNTDADGTGDHNHGYFDPQAALSTSLLVAAGTYPIGGPDLTSTNGAHVHHFFTENSGDHSHSITTDSQGNHSHTVSLGGGAQLMSVLSPVIVMTKIIFAGRQAITATTLATTTTPRREPSAPLRGSH